MTKNKHGFVLKQQFDLGGINWTIIETAEDTVKCITTDVIEKKPFDRTDLNDFACSDIEEFLNSEFLKKLLSEDVPVKIFDTVSIDLITDDGLKQYGIENVKVGLITCDEYRKLRDNIPLIQTWWWTATADTYRGMFVRYINELGTIGSHLVWFDEIGVRPVCNFKSEILKFYLDTDGKQ